MKYISTLNNRGRGSSNRFLPAPRSGGNRYSRPRAERRDRRRIGSAMVCAFRRAAGPLRKIGKTLFGGAAALFVLGGVSLGLLVGYLCVIHSDYFMVRKVVLSGLDKVTREEILSKTGLDQASNIVTLRLGPMAESIRAIPWVESVTISRKLPDTVLVQVTERRIRTLISLGDLYYLDDNGHPFKKIEPGWRPTCPSSRASTARLSWNDRISPTGTSRKSSACSKPWPTGTTVSGSITSRKSILTRCAD